MGASGGVVGWGSRCGCCRRAGGLRWLDLLGFPVVSPQARWGASPNTVAEDARWARISGNVRLVVSPRRISHRSDVRRMHSRVTRLLTGTPTARILVQISELAAVIRSPMSGRLHGSEITCSATQVRGRTATVCPWEAWEGARSCAEPVATEQRGFCDKRRPGRHDGWKRGGERCAGGRRRRCMRARRARRGAAMAWMNP